MVRRRCRSPPWPASSPVAGVTLSADPADGPDAVKADAGIAGSLTGTVKLTSPSKITITLNSASGIAAVFSQLTSNSITIAIPHCPPGSPSGPSA